MSRWEPNARGRLEEAALALYAERGFDQTTAAEIAKRAGLTERTFFRYFTDKREVLFAGREVLQDIFTEAVTGAPATASPIEAAAAGLEATGALFAQRRDLVRQRQAIIAANPVLQERELIKLAALATALAGALRRRGVPDVTADLTAEVAMAVFRIAFDRWVQETGEPDLTELIRACLGELKRITNPEPARRKRK